VLSQNPPPASQLATSASVVLFVSGGPAPATASGTGVLTCRYDTEEHEAYCQGDKLIQYEDRFGYAPPGSGAGTSSGS